MSDLISWRGCSPRKLREASRNAYLSSSARLITLYAVFEHPCTKMLYRGWVVVVGCTDRLARCGTIIFETDCCITSSTRCDSAGPRTGFGLGFGLRALVGVLTCSFSGGCTPSSMTRAMYGRGTSGRVGKKRRVASSIVYAAIEPFTPHRLI